MGTRRYDCATCGSVYLADSASTTLTCTYCASSVQNPASFQIEALNMQPLAPYPMQTYVPQSHRGAPVGPSVRKVTVKRRGRLVTFLRAVGIFYAATIVIAIVVATVLIVGNYLYKNIGYFPNGGVTVPFSSEEVKGQPYRIVVDAMKDRGFKDVRAEAVPDLVIGFLDSEGDVKEVSIGGVREYQSGQRFDSEEIVRVYYHSFD